MIRRSLFFVGVVALLIAALAGTGGIASAQTLSGYDAYVLSPLLTLRAQPSTTAAAVASLQSGDHMNIDGRDSTSKWLHVKTEYNQVGWLLRAYLYVSNAVVIANLPILAGNPGGGGPVATPVPGQTSAPTATPASSLPPPVRGRVGGRFELGGQVQDLNGSTVDAMRRSGMKWVKRQVGAGDGGGVGMINQAHGLGLKILLSVVGSRGAVMDPGYQNDYANYVGNLAASGADAIEIWNEMNLDREWPTGQIDPKNYVPLLAKAYNAIKSKSCGTIVVTGALAPTGAEGAYGRDRVWNDDKYYAGMAAAGAGRYADCIGVHYNEGIVSPYQSSGDPRGNYPTRYFRSMLSRALRGFSQPACFTELGYLTPQGYGGLPGNFGWAANTTVAQQAAWLAQAAVSASNTGRVRLMIIFNVDFTAYGDDPMGGYAMIRPGGACPACDALGRVVR